MATMIETIIRSDKDSSEIFSLRRVDELPDGRYGAQQLTHWPAGWPHPSMRGIVIVGPVHVLDRHENGVLRVRASGIESVTPWGPACDWQGALTA